MKTHALYLPFFALLCSTLSSMGGVQASPSAVDSVHFCLNDSEHWSRDRARRLADLNVGKPRTVRMIYFLPNDRSFRADVVDSMKSGIRSLQAFYADQMQAHGYGNRTFRFETDEWGDPLVHRVDDLDGSGENEIYGIYPMARRSAWEREVLA